MTAVLRPTFTLFMTITAMTQMLTSMPALTLTIEHRSIDNENGNEDVREDGSEVRDFA